MTILSPSCMSGDFCLPHCTPSGLQLSEKATETLMESSISEDQKQYLLKETNCPSSFLCTRHCTQAGSLTLAAGRARSTSWGQPGPAGLFSSSGGGRAHRTSCTQSLSCRPTHTQQPQPMAQDVLGCRRRHYPKIAAVPFDITQ